MGRYEDVVSGDCVLDDLHLMKPWEIRIAGEITVNTDICLVQSRMVSKKFSDGSTMLVCDLQDAHLGFGYVGPQRYSQADFESLYKAWCKQIKESIERRGGKSMEFLIAARTLYHASKEHFNNFQFYRSRSNNKESLIFGYWDDEARAMECPKFLFIKQALIFST